MGKFIKPGKIVIVLSGRFAGRKAVVLKTYDDGHDKRRFGHALIAGIDKYPRKITRAMSDKKKATRMRVKPFVKFINFNHIMPTRYNLDAYETLKTAAADANLVDPSKKKELVRSVKTAFEDRYKNFGVAKNEKVATGVHYFFRKLHF